MVHSAGVSVQWGSEVHSSALQKIYPIEICDLDCNLVSLEAVYHRMFMFNLAPEKEVLSIYEKINWSEKKDFFIMILIIAGEKSCICSVFGLVIYLIIGLRW